MQSKIQVRLNTHGNYTINLTIANMTEGKLLATCRALTFYNSPVGNDVLSEIMNLLYKENRTMYEDIKSNLKILEEKMIEHAEQ